MKAGFVLKGISRLAVSVLILNSISVTASEAKPVSSLCQLSISENPFGYSDYYTDKESGFYCCKARYYSPRYGVFSSRDTYDLPDRYAYCNANPVMRIDPEGHNFLPTLLVIGTFAAPFILGACCRGLRFGVTDYSVSLSSKICRVVEKNTERASDEILISRLSGWKIILSSLVVGGLTSGVCYLVNNDKPGVIPFLGEFAGESLLAGVGYAGMSKLLDLHNQYADVESLGLELNEGAKASDQPGALGRGLLDDFSPWEQQSLTPVSRLKLINARRTQNVRLDTQLVHDYLLASRIIEKGKY